MVSSSTHLVDIGDDAKGILCRCLATGCGWSFSSEIRNERLNESYKHIAQVIIQ